MQRNVNIGGKAPMRAPLGVLRTMCTRGARLCAHRDGAPIRPDSEFCYCWDAARGPSWSLILRAQNNPKGLFEAWLDGGLADSVSSIMAELADENECIGEGDLYTAYARMLGVHKTYDGGSEQMRGLVNTVLVALEDRPLGTLADARALYARLHGQRAAIGLDLGTHVARMRVFAPLVRLQAYTDGNDIWMRAAAPSARVANAGTSADDDGTAFRTWHSDEYKNRLRAAGGGPHADVGLTQEYAARTYHGPFGDDVAMDMHRAAIQYGLVLEGLASVIMASALVTDVLHVVFYAPRETEHGRADGSVSAAHTRVPPASAPRAPGSAFVLSPSSRGGGAAPRSAAPPLSDTAVYIAGKAAARVVSKPDFSDSDGEFDDGGASPWASLDTLRRLASTAPGPGGVKFPSGRGADPTPPLDADGSDDAEDDDAAAYVAGAPAAASPGAVKRVALDARPARARVGDLSVVARHIRAYVRETPAAAVPFGAAVPIGAFAVGAGAPTSGEAMGARKYAHLVAFQWGVAPPAPGDE